jgi:hypothetical protein
LGADLGKARLIEEFRARLVDTTRTSATVTGDGTGHAAEVLGKKGGHEEIDASQNRCAAKGLGQCGDAELGHRLLLSFERGRA